MRMNYWSAAMACAIAAGGMLAGSEARAQGTDENVLVAPSRQAATLVPDASAVDLSGRTWSLRALRGRPVILSLFATWCPACRANMSQLDALQKKYASSGLVILAVSKEDSGLLSDYARASGHAVPLLKGSQEMMNAFGLQAWPTTFFIGSDSRVLARIIGTSPAYTRLLAEMTRTELGAAAPVAAAPTARRSSSARQPARARYVAKAPARRARPTTAWRRQKGGKDEGVVILSNSGRRVIR